MKDLKHQQARENIEKSLAGMLSAGEIAVLEAHLDTCEDCRNFQARVIREESALRAALGAAVPRPEISQQKVRLTIERTRAQLKSHHRWLIAGRLIRTAGLAALTIAVAYGMSWLFSTFTSPTPEPAAPIASPTILDSAQINPALEIATLAPVIESTEPSLGYTPFSRQLRLTLNIPGETVNSVAFSPDGSQIAAASSDGLVRIWRVRDGALLTTIEAHAKQAASVAYSPDGSLLVTGGRDGQVNLWLAKSGAFIKTVFSNEALVEAVQFSPNGELLAVTLSNYSVALVRISDGKQLESFSSLIRLDVHTASDRNGFLIASSQSAIWLASEDNTPFSLNIQGQSGRTLDIVLSGNGSLLASASTDGLIYLWRIFDITIVEDSRFTQNHQDRVSRLISGSLLFTLDGHTDWANNLDFSSDNTYLVSGSEDGTIILWSLEDGSEAEMLVGHDGAINSVDISPDDSMIASGSDDGTVRIWSMTDY